MIGHINARRAIEEESEYWRKRIPQSEFIHGIVWGLKRARELLDHLPHHPYTPEGRFPKLK